MRRALAGLAVIAALNSHSAYADYNDDEMLKRSVAEIATMNLAELSLLTDALSTCFSSDDDAPLQARAACERSRLRWALECGGDRAIDILLPARAFEIMFIGLQANTCATRGQQSALCIESRDNRTTFVKRDVSVKNALGEAVNARFRALRANELESLWQRLLKL